MAIVFDNAASAQGAAATLSFNLTLGNASGSNRLLVVGVSVNGGEVGIVHYDGRPAHFVGVQVDGALRTYLYYIFDVNLPAAAGTYLLEVFGSVGLTSIAAVAVAVKGAFQGAPEATAQSSVASNTAISTSISPITADAMVFDVVGTLAPSITTLTPAAGQTKRDQQDGASSDVAVSTRSFSSGGPTSVGWSFNAPATKAGHIVAVWAPAAGGSQQPGLKDIRTAVTTIVTPAGSGNFTVTGVGFKGKAVFLWGVPVQGTSVAIDAAQWLGIADDASPTIRQKSVMVSSRGGVAHTRCIADRQNAISILRADVDAPVVVGNITSWNDDGFVINFTSTTAGYVIFAMVLGGADLKSYVGEANVGSGTGSVTGLPFSPDLGIAITNDASIGAAPTQTATQAFGVFDKNLNQWWVGSFHGVEDTIKKNSLLKTTTGFVGQLSKSGSPANPAVIWEARVTAISANGFSWTGNDGDGFFYLALNLGGSRAVVGSITKSTAAAPVTQKLPDPGWKPQAYLLASAVKNNQDPTTALGNRVAIGAFSGSRQRSSLRTDPDAATNADQRANDQRVLGLGDTDAAYTALARALPIVDQTPGFEWSPNDSQARLIGFLSIEQGIVSPVQLETPVRITSVRSLPAGTPTTRTADESVVLELLDSVNPTGYRLEHLTNPAQGTAGGWSPYFELTEGIVFGAGALIEVHSSSSDGDPEPRPGRTHRYKVASGPAQFILNAGDDIVRLVRPDGVTVEEMPVLVVSDPGSGGRIVRGEVRNKADALVPGVLVEALQLTWTTLGLRETSLGRFVTNAQGQYEIKYTPVDGGSTDCGPPADEVNLVVRALAGDLIQPREELMRSGIVSPAREDETVNLVVDRSAPTSESRYVIIDRQFRRCLSTQASDQLQVWYGVRDTAGYLQFAAHATGLPADEVLAYAQANLIAYEINRVIPFGGSDPRYTEFGAFPAEAAFAITRQGQGSLVSEAVKLDPAQFLTTLVTAMDRGLVDRAFDAKLPFSAVQSITRQWSLIRAFFITDNTLNNVARSDQTKLLELVLTEAKRQTVAAKQSEYHGTFAELVAALEADATLTAAEAENLLFVFEVYARSNHYPLVSILFGKKAARGWKTVADLATVTRRAENGVEGWMEIALQEIPTFPPDIFGRTFEEKAASHARRLFETFSAEFSQTRFVDGAAQLGSSTSDPDLQSAVAFIEANPSFNLVETHLNRFLQENQLSLPEAPAQKLLQLQRLRRLTPEFSAATSLLSAGLDSAVAISRFDEQRFVADFEQVLGGLQKALLIHRKATLIASDVFSNLVRFHEELNTNGGGSALPGSLNISTALTEGTSNKPQFARYATLFGNLFSCASRQCETVLSPSAYLVDLLQFAAGHPRDLILERRPDIVELELNCSNTDRVQPYIDLVIERLSAVVAPWSVTLSVSAAVLDQASAEPQRSQVLNLVKAGNPVAGEPPLEAFHFTERAVIRKLGASEWAIEDDSVRWRIKPSGGQFVAEGTPQTGESSELLSVFPEHDNPLAERALGRAVFPFHLPLAMGRREVELILKQRGTTRAEVLAAFPQGLAAGATPPDPLALVATAAHARIYLQATLDEEKALLSTEKPAHQYWGFTGVGNETMPRPEEPLLTVTGPWRDLLTEVSIFLHRTGLTYAQTLDLLATEFVQDPAHPIVISAEPEEQRECNYNRFKLVQVISAGQAGALDEAALRRISFFLRLWRKLGWDMHTLDRYLIGLKLGADPRALLPDLLQLARIVQLAEQLGLEPAATFVFYKDLDLRDSERLGPSQFERVLMKGPRSSIGYQLLKDVSRGLSPSVPDQAALESLQSNLRTALGIKRDDLLELWNELVPSTTFPLTLTLADLSTLSRTAIFIRALNLSAKDYFRAIATLALNPFAGATVADKLASTHTAIVELRALAGSGLPLALVAYLLGYPGAEGHALLPTADALNQVRRQLTVAARAIEQRYPIIQGADEAGLSSLLAEVMPAQKVPAVISEIATPSAPPDSALLLRYFSVFLPDDAATFISGILAPDPADQGQVAARLARLIPLVAAPLRAFLLGRARRERALALAAETFGISVATADFLLSRGLSSTSDPAQRALVDWQTAVGAFDVDFAEIATAFSSSWVAPSDATVRFVAVYATSAGSPPIAITSDGDALGIEATVPQPDTGLTTVTFARIDVRAGDVRQFSFANPGTAVTLAVRLDNNDPSALPLGWFTSFGLTSYIKLQKAALLAVGAKLDAVELDALVALDEAAAPAERLLDKMPVAPVPDPLGWSNLRLYLERLALHRGLPMQGSSLFELLSAELPPSETDAANLTGWKEADIHDALQGLWSAAPALDDVNTWAVLARAIRFAGRLDLGVKQALDLLVTGEPSGLVARTLREGLRAKFTEQDFVAAFKAPRDLLRQAHRDALVGYLTSRPVTTGSGSQFFVGPNDLFAHFLIDVEMEADTEISRTKLAISSIQLFVQRANLGLEDRVAISWAALKKEQWKWMQSYRVWEANRKVFLYPENWIEPQLRDDKSELFKLLEEELLQDDIDDARAQGVLATYVERLKELSELSIVGMHVYGSTLYFIGRTRAKPYVYYHRSASRSQIGGKFTPWTEIPFEIDSEFVAPAEVDKDLFIFWPLVLEKEAVQDSDTNDKSTLDPVALIRLLWARLDSTTGKWSKPRLGTSALIDRSLVPALDRGSQNDTVDTTGYHLACVPSGDGGVRVDVYKTNDPTKPGSKSTAYDPTFLGSIVITRQGQDLAWQDGRPVNPAGLWPQASILRNGVAYEDTRFDYLRLAGSYYLYRVPAAEPFRFIASDAAYFTLPDNGAFLFESAGTHILGDIDRIYPDPGFANRLVREVLLQTFDHPVMPQIMNEFRNGGAPAIMKRLTQALPTSKNRSVYTYHPVGGDAYRPATVYGRSYTYYGGVYLGYYIAGDSMAYGITQRDFELDYGPDKLTVQRGYPLPTVEFGYGKPQGIYNWELFFHLPILVADRLSQQLRFEDAIKWLHYVFDPRNELNEYEQTKPWVDSLPDGARYWNFLPFFANRNVADSLLDLFGANEKVFNPKRDQELKVLIESWRQKPFSPHLLARQRIAAYQKFTVMKYLDTLIAWGDQLFRQDTFEAINQATQLYVLASELLGDRPEIIEDHQSAPRASYRDLAAQGIDAFSNALVELETLSLGSTILASAESLPAPAPELDFVSSTAFSTLHFRVPRNEKLEGYWDTVADRLFKIRNSLNIDGVKRQLALFEPPIDPGLLVKAQAAGIDLSSAISQLSRPLPHYRFSVWVGQAKELASELKSFSGALLAALEKKDAEELALIRQDQELRLLAKVTELRKAQLKDAEQNLAALRERRNMPVDRIADLTSRKFISPTEASNMSLTREAGGLDTAAGVMNTIGGVLGVIPQLTVGFVSADAEFGGQHLSSIFQAFGSALSTASTVARTDATLAGMLSSYERRQEDWNMQIRQAQLELKDIDAQIIGAEIRIDIAQKELENHELQIEHSEQIRTFMQDKFSNRELYQWMIGQLGNSYQQAYRLAYDVAKTAERSFAFELGLDAPEFIQFEYRDNLRRGLLAGEKLFLDLKRMEVAYLEQNKRELEITKPISLESINPAALQELREKGSCEFALPEILFDLDFPGQYFRRIRAVRLTIPAVTGPYTSVSAKLSLLSSAIRVKSAADPDSYPYQGLEDPRFVQDTRGIQSIAVSRAQDDAGVFELNFRDDRYLPFEGAGVVSRWRLELPEVARQFDYSSVSDVVLQVSYTAREAGGSLKQGALNSIEDSLNGLRHLVSAATDDANLSRVFSMKREFPDALHQLLSSVSGTTTLTLRKEHFPRLFEQLGFKLHLADENGNVSLSVQTKGDVSAARISLALDAEPPGAWTNLTTPPVNGFVHGPSIARGSDDIVATGQEQWTLQQEGLSVDTVDDIIFDLRYTVGEQ